MEKPSALVASDYSSDLPYLEEFLSSEGYCVFTADSIGRVLDLAEAGKVEILIMESAFVTNGSGSSSSPISALRSKCFGTPHQIVLLVSDGDDLETVADLGADDFISRPFTEPELSARLKAASIRLRNEQRLLEEREFFKMAVRQEEELSSKILEEHMDLKQAFENVEVLNRELKESNKRLEKIAQHDILSGLLNRMSIFTLMDVEIERAVRGSVPLSGIMMDLDDFKEVNDNYGHPHGDEVIRQIGQRLRGTLRKYDRAGRYGGEEFFIVLPNTATGQANIIAERFRAKLEKEPIVYEGDTLRITASLGVAEYHTADTREEWVARADRALYQAKREGKNRVVCL